MHNNIIQFLIFILLLILCTQLLGGYMANVLQGQKTLFSRIIGPFEHAIYKICAINSTNEMHWKEYAWHVIIFSVFGLVFVFLIQFLQAYFFFNPEHFSNVSWDLAFNTAASFVTNTNWQAYAGETTMSYLTQMIALTVQNFLSAAIGMSVAFALIRGIINQSKNTIGNFWVDMTRSILYVLIPLSIVFAVFLISQGVIQNFLPYIKVIGLEGTSQTIPMGPAASQIAIKLLGTNGGGFFNTNSAHPFENPTALSNFFEMFAIILIPAAFTFTFGTVANSKRHGWIIFSVMMFILTVFFIGSLYSENIFNPIFEQSGIMEGKETRFGVFGSILFSVVTTMSSCGAINAMHSSLSPLSGGIALLNMMLGEIIYGGVGSGLYGMLLFVLLTVFIAGLMIGRTPEYFGKKIDAREMTWVLVAILAPCAVILLGSALSVVLSTGQSSIFSKGPHGLTEVLYAFSSAAGNNGSAFAGLNANTTYYNLMIGFSMLIGRYLIIVPILAIAGSLSIKKTSQNLVGSFNVNSSIFAVLLIAIILFVGALTFLPALTLGPIIEHLLMMKGMTF